MINLGTYLVHKKYGYVCYFSGVDGINSSGVGRIKTIDENNIEVEDDVENYEVCSPFELMKAYNHAQSRRA